MPNLGCMTTAQTHLLTLHDSAYPDCLRHIANPPKVLFAQGDLTRLHKPCFAIVGARHASADGLDNAHAFAAHLALQNWCIVSGLAQGIDAASHEGAIAAGPAGGGTIAVLGTGIDVVYPKGHAPLIKKILACGGLIISELSAGTPPLAHNFPKRNRIVAGLCRGVLVVEAAARSGSLITARLANEMGREVFAIPGSIHSPLSRGPHQLIQQGAKLVTCANDILTELVPTSPSDRICGLPASEQTFLPEQTSSPLLSAIGYDPVSEDTLLRRSQLSLSELSCELLTLELQGVILRRPDGYIVRIRA